MLLHLSVQVSESRKCLGASIHFQFANCNWFLYIRQVPVLICSKYSENLYIILHAFELFNCGAFKTEKNSGGKYPVKSNQRLMALDLSECDTFGP
jgi:hypothetical protein